MNAVGELLLEAIEYIFNSFINRIIWGTENNLVPCHKDRINNRWVGVRSEVIECEAFPPLRYTWPNITKNFLNKLQKIEGRSSRHLLKSHPSIPIYIARNCQYQSMFSRMTIGPLLSHPISNRKLHYFSSHGL